MPWLLSVMWPACRLSPRTPAFRGAGARRTGLDRACEAQVQAGGRLRLHTG